DDRGPPPLDPEHMLTDDRAFDAAKFGLAARFEELRDRSFLRRLDFRIRIEEVPTHSMRQAAADRRLARCHEADEVESGSAFEPEIHAVSFNSAMRPSTIEGKSRAAATRSHPARGANTVRASRSTPRRIATAHSAAVIAARLARATRGGAWPR